MIFLVTQMAVGLLCALVAGAAIGWLAHRARSGPTIKALRDTVFRQRAHVEQARTDVSLISQDFDELKQRSRAEIEALAHENRRLPSLSKNLEKSQLLVRQLMQKHEAQLRDLAAERHTLNQRLKQLTDREEAFRQVSAELDRARQQLVTIDVASPSHGAANTDSLQQTDQPVSDAATVDPGLDVDPAAEPTSETLPEPVREANVESDPAPAAGADASMTDPDHPRFEPVDDDAITTSTDAGSSTPPDAAPPTSWASARVPDITLSPTDPSAHHGGVSRNALLRSIGLGFDMQTSDASNDEPDTLLDEAIELDELDAEPESESEFDEPDPLPATSSIEPGQRPAAEDAPAATIGDDNRLFDPVDRHDDLKQIFGIGPMTEKALNQLGITSYSQLAELEHHDIHTIAEALQIFPSRIERDDWVGNARRQLEDVLEEL